MHVAPRPPAMQDEYARLKGPLFDIYIARFGTERCETSVQNARIRALLAARGQLRPGKGARAHRRPRLVAANKNGPPGERSGRQPIRAAMPLFFTIPYGSRPSSQGTRAQPTAALLHQKAPRGCSLLDLRQSAYHANGLRFQTDESSVAGQC
ncbi:hypothetical protein [Roseovarius sp. SYSU LYC5161]|uniref:hypothetical protein n=1 Tax=Roseovarius halophilus (ex Wu et al. 2025) TaxID=3376060 RepID=UPI00399B71E6